MMRAFSLALAAMLLTGCASGPGKSAPVSEAPIASIAKAATVPVKRVCPAKTQWSESQFDTLAAAMAALPPNSPIWGLEKDWQKMRDADDACAKAPAGK